MKWRPLAGRGTGGVLLACMMLAGSSSRAALLDFWRLEEGSGTSLVNAVSSGPTGYVHVTPSYPNPFWMPDGGHPTWTPPAVLSASSSKCIYMESAVGNYLAPVNINLLSDGAGGAATVALWLKPDNIANDTRILTQSVSTGNYNGTVRLWGDGSAAVYSGGGWLALAPAGSLSINFSTWQHVAFVWKTNEVTLYVNGVNKGRATAIFDYTTGNAGGLAIGAPSGLLHGVPYRGLIDEVSIWNQALSSNQVVSLAGGTSPLVLLNPRHGTILAIF